MYALCVVCFVCAEHTLRCSRVQTLFQIGSMRTFKNKNRNRRKHNLRGLCSQHELWLLTCADNGSGDDSGSGTGVLECTTMYALGVCVSAYGLATCAHWSAAQVPMYGQHASAQPIPTFNLIAPTVPAYLLANRCCPGLSVYVCLVV